MEAGTIRWVHAPQASGQRADLQQTPTAGRRVCGEKRATKETETGVREGKVKRVDCQEVS